MSSESGTHLVISTIKHIDYIVNGFVVTVIIMHGDYIHQLLKKQVPFSASLFPQPTTFKPEQYLAMQNKSNF